MTIYKGIPVHFTYRSAGEIRPGPVPGGGGTHDEWVCDGCGWRLMHKVFGGFYMGEEQIVNSQFEHDLFFHEQKCPKIAALEGKDG